MVHIRATAEARGNGTFRNWGGFCLYEPSYQEWADRLWEQLRRLGAESYIADGNFFTFATRNAGLFTSVLVAFSASTVPPDESRLC